MWQPCRLERVCCAPKLCPCPCPGASLSPSPHCICICAAPSGSSDRSGKINLSLTWMVGFRIKFWSSESRSDEGRSVEDEECSVEDEECSVEVKECSKGTAAAASVAVAETSFEDCPVCAAPLPSCTLSSIPGWSVLGPADSALYLASLLRATAIWTGITSQASSAASSTSTESSGNSRDHRTLTVALQSCTPCMIFTTCSSIVFLKALV